jgi:hypothetical protein
VRKLLLSLLFFCGVAYGQTPTITTPTFTDDSYVHVPLQFGFPFYNRVFTNSWMHSNGIVSFFDPAVPLPGQSYNPAAWAYCCAGVDLVPSNTQLGPQFNYMISALWTDLYPIATSSFRTEGTTTYQRYFWNNIPEISNQSNLNSFSLEIRPSGYIGASYTQLGVRNQDVTAGITGDIALGEMQKFYFGRGIPGQSLQDWSVNSTSNACSTNPLSSPTCPGYAAAYLTQQCSISALYDPSCPGYQQAYSRANFLQNLLSVSSSSSNSTTSDSTLESSMQVQTTSASPADVTAVVSLTSSATSSGRLYGTGTAKQDDEEDLSLYSLNSNSSKTNGESKNDKKSKEEKEKKSRKKEENTAGMTEFEKQVAAQPKIIDSMSFVPGFSLYAQANVPDVLERQMKKLYGKDVVDNRNAGRRMFGGSDRLHEEMVNQQYK